MKKRRKHRGMRVSQAFRMAIAAVTSNKMRSFLTMLGIIIGVMAVTLLISLVQGASNTVTDRLDDLGGNQLIVQITSPRKKMTLYEVMKLEEEQEIAKISPAVSGNGTAIANGNDYDVSITGITDRYPDLQKLDLESGRSVNQNDLDYRLNVVILGNQVATKLFGNTDCVGETIRLEGKDYRIIGVAEKAEETMYSSPNDTVYLPITNAQRLMKQAGITAFYASAEDGYDLSDAQTALKRALLTKFGNDDHFSVVNMANVMDIIGDVMSTLELLLAAIAGISLVVGGIGIMNIMLVSVTERTREIGIRKAIGAQRSNIIVQFLIESVILSVAGGIIGMAISQGILSLVNYLYPTYHFFITGQVAVIALGFSLFVGVVFGIYPAQKAANLKPINALRYE